MNKCQNSQTCRILRPFSTLLTWALGGVGILQTLHCVGVNVQPLLAAGGVSGIALGFGAQKLTQNVLSGAKLVRTAEPQGILIFNISIPCL